MNGVYTEANVAFELWKKLKHAFVDTAKVIEQIIETKAWEPLGYDSFTEAWTDQMAGVSLAGVVKAHVVYQMYHEGRTPEFVQENVHGVGAQTASYLDRQRRNGVPASHASHYPPHDDRSHLISPSPSSVTMTEERTIVVREHERVPASAPQEIHINVGPAMLREYQRIARKYNTSVEELAKGFIAQGFKNLVAADKQMS